MPTDPGVYLMKDRKGRIIYVGKATNLQGARALLLQPAPTRATSCRCSARILGDIETVIVNNEKEALLLENNLIKQHQPRFNVKLVDDKNYLVLRLDPKARYPRLEVTRRIGNDGAKYFGPYHSATSCRADARGRQPPLQAAHLHRSRAATRASGPCLQYQIKRCDAPCVYPITDEEYGKQVQDVALFLDGKDDELLKRLGARMKEAAAERAVRDRRRACATRSRRSRRRSRSSAWSRPTSATRTSSACYPRGRVRRDRRAHDPQRQAARAAATSRSRGRSSRRRRSCRRSSRSTTTSAPSSPTRCCCPRPSTTPTTKAEWLREKRGERHGSR